MGVLANFFAALTPRPEKMKYCADKNSPRIRFSKNCTLDYRYYAAGATPVFMMDSNGKYYVSMKYDAPPKKSAYQKLKSPFGGVTRSKSMLRPPRNEKIKLVPKPDTENVQLEDNTVYPVAVWNPGQLVERQQDAFGGKTSSSDLNERVVWYCLRRMQRQYSEFLFLYPTLSIDKSEGVTRYLEMVQAKNREAVFMIISSRNTANEHSHCSLVAYFRSLNTFYHFDAENRNRYLAYNLIRRFYNDYFKADSFIHVPAESRFQNTDSKMHAIGNICKLTRMLEIESGMNNKGIVDFVELSNQYPTGTISPLDIGKFETRPNDLALFLFEQYDREKLEEYDKEDKAELSTEICDTAS